MLVYRRLSIYLFSLLVLVVLGSLWLWPQFWYIYLFFLLIIPFLSIYLLNNYRLDQLWLYLSIAPAFLLMGSFLFLLFIDLNFLRYLLPLAIALFYLTYLNNVFLYLTKSSRYLPNSLENTANYLNILSMFFIYTCAFSFPVLAIGRLRYMILLVFLSTLIIAWQSLWINKINDQRNRYFILASGLLLTELYWALHYWPTSFLVNGLILTIIFYAALNLIRHHFLDSLTKKIAWRYLLVSGLIIGAALATAQWT